MTSTTIHSTTIGAHLHRIARAIAPLVALAYVAGLALGDWIHWLNDRLAGRGRERWAAPARPRPVALSGAQQRLLLAAVPATPERLDGQGIPFTPCFTLTLPRHAGKVPSFLPEAIHALGLLTVPQLRRLARECGLSRKLYTYGRRGELIAALIWRRGELIGALSQ